MPIVSSSFVSPIRYETVFNLPKDEYDVWYNRLLDQLLSRVEVPGYRPGKAPKPKLLANIDPEKIASVVFQETVDKYAPSMVQDANQKILTENADNIVLNHNVDQDKVMIDESGFTFTLVSTVLPAIDLSAIGKEKIPAPKDEEIFGKDSLFPSFEDFHTQEIGKFLHYFNTYEATKAAAKKGTKLIVDLVGSVKGVVRPDLGGPKQEIVLGFGRYLPDFEKGLMGTKPDDQTTFKVKFPKDYFVEELRGESAEFEAKILESTQGKYTTIEELVEKNQNPTFRSLVPSMEVLEVDIKSAYENNKEQIRRQKHQVEIIQKILASVPDFALPEDSVEAEFKRIQANVIEKAEKNALSLAEVIKSNGVPFSKAPKNQQEADIILRTYVSNEFKLSSILNYIYLRKLNSAERVSQAQVDELVADMMKNPAQYNLVSNLTKELATREANDRMVRARAMDWLIKTVTA